MSDNSPSRSDHASQTQPRVLAHIPHLCPQCWGPQAISSHPLSTWAVLSTTSLSQSHHLFPALHRRHLPVLVIQHTAYRECLANSNRIHYYPRPQQSPLPLAAHVLQVSLTDSAPCFNLTHPEPFLDLFFYTKPSSAGAALDVLSSHSLPLFLTLTQNPIPDTFHPRSSNSPS